MIFLTKGVMNLSLLFLNIYIYTDLMDQFIKHCIRRVDRCLQSSKYLSIPICRRLLRKYQLCNNVTLHMLLNIMEVILRIQIYG